MFRNEENRGALYGWMDEWMDGWMDGWMAGWKTIVS